MNFPRKSAILADCTLIIILIIIITGGGSKKEKARERGVGLKGVEERGY